MPETGTESFTAIVVAAGNSSRMGFNKLLAPLGGRPVVWHSLKAFSDCPQTHEIILVGRADVQDALAAMVAEFPKCQGVVAGGATRTASVLNGLAAVSDPDGFVAIHDAARPLIRPATISACFAAACQYGAAVCAEPTTDTLHRADANGVLRSTVPRDNLWRMQTPQIFRAAQVAGACRAAIEQHTVLTDEAGAAIHLGIPVRVVANPEWNFKITHPRDLALAEAAMKMEPNR